MRVLPTQTSTEKILCHYTDRGHGKGCGGVWGGSSAQSEGSYPIQTHLQAENKQA